MTDIDKILELCMDSPNQNVDKFGAAQLNQMLLLKTTTEMVPQLVEALRVAECGRLRKIKMDFENPHYQEIAKRIQEIILDDAHMEKGAMGRMQRCFAIKPEINGLLDVARRTYSELVEDIQKLVEDLNKTYDLPLRLHQNVMKGFHIIMPIAPKNRKNFSVEDLPPIFIHVPPYPPSLLGRNGISDRGKSGLADSHWRKKTASSRPHSVQNNISNVSMTTEELVVLDHQAKETLNEIQRLSNVIITMLLKNLRPFMSILYKLCENVAELDVLLALAQNASPEHNFTVVTGPNMGGKSIYIKQAATLQIMAQVGCFVPATNAVLRLSDRIFSRIGFNDSVELNASTYVLEMKEIHHILKGLTKCSLVIIDELCRGTSSEEGASIAWAVCEELLASEAFTFFTTHFMYLTRLQDIYYNVVNLHTATREENVPDNMEVRRLIYEHKIEPAITRVKHYGLTLASKTNLPEETINLAKELVEFIMKKAKPQSFGRLEESEDRLLYTLNAEIRREERRNTSTSEEIIRRIITMFKRSHPQLVAKLRSERRNATSGSTDSCKTSAKSFDNVHKSSTLVSDTLTNSSNCNRNTRPVIVNMSVETNIDVEPVPSEELSSTIQSTKKLLKTVIENDVSKTVVNVSIDCIDQPPQDTFEAEEDTVIFIPDSIKEFQRSKAQRNTSNRASPFRTQYSLRDVNNARLENCSNSLLQMQELDKELDKTQLIDEDDKHTRNMRYKSPIANVIENTVLISDNRSILSLSSDDIELMEQTLEEINKDTNDLCETVNLEDVTFSSSSSENTLSDYILLTPPMGFRDDTLNFV
ncbi:MutS protein homolog 4 [Eumeta japonica]|uniref:MutS protein homolog 4 n=1 Tax=Eumeta variegata TaxID=151549 RepID=A0A4C1W5A1_EUMVA|nr:MutS protein homolog 4 [Eumeta japonica]